MKFRDYSWRKNFIKMWIQIKNCKKFFRNFNNNQNSILKIYFSIKDKALKLQVYYKKLCDDERNSSLRNQHILAEMSRVDQHFQYLESKLERLTTLKVN